ncbi:phage portal protein [Mesorhizobium silamurunense]|uniref:phage portal protein n=1 Tax=Mesorhizobium silamurunense TaxID=499528 RepID=UPI00177E3B18|nr:phage portal protein [Mesorhizobium silamurunense]
MNFKSWIGRRFGLTDTAPWSYFYGGASAAGKAVTDNTAMQLATVWSCVRLNSEAASCLPLQLFEKDGRGGRNPIDHPLAEIIGDSPNADQTAFEFWGAMVAWLMVRGNAYAEIVKLGDRITALNLLPADQVNVTREAGELRYKFTDRGKAVDLPAESVLHIRGFGFGGDLGLSPIRFGVQTFGSAIAADEAAGKIFGNGLMPSGVLSTESELNTEQRKQLDEILKKYSTSTNAGKVMVLEAGLKFEQLSLNPEDMQMLETRRFNVEEICRWFGVPPVVIGHAAQGVTAWGTGIEQLLLQWLTTGLNPILTRIEKRIAKQLIAPGERRRVYAEFNREALLQADSVAKASFLSTMVQNALMSRNEARAKLNLPHAGASADALTAQTNLAPLDRLGGDNTAAAKAAFRSWLGIEENQNVD